MAGQAGPGPGDPQERNRYGVNFRVNGSVPLLGQIMGSPSAPRNISALNRWHALHRLGMELRVGETQDANPEKPLLTES